MYSEIIQVSYLAGETKWSMHKTVKHAQTHLIYSATSQNLASPSFSRISQSQHPAGMCPTSYMGGEVVGMTDVRHSLKKTTFSYQQNFGISLFYPLFHHTSSQQGDLILSLSLWNTICRQYWLPPPYIIYPPDSYSHALRTFFSPAGDIPCQWQLGKEYELHCCNSTWHSQDTILKMSSQVY